MDFSEIKRLVKLVESSSIDEIEIQDEGFQIRVSKSQNVSVAPMQVQSPVPVQKVEVPATRQIQADAPEVPILDENIFIMKAPMVGTLYRSPSPDADPFIKEGDRVQPGKVLCIIEAMKLMNEIEAEVSGKIVKVLVEDGQAVEYNQPLFHIQKA